VKICRQEPIVSEVEAATMAAERKPVEVLVSEEDVEMLG
tara:strand:+ start:401 stop:517 length:117 start_codon:yes stop_codon:yes gene_type:complete